MLSRRREELPTGRLFQRGSENEHTNKNHPSNPIHPQAINQALARGGAPRRPGTQMSWHPDVPSSASPRGREGTPPGTPGHTGTGQEAEPPLAPPVGGPGRVNHRRPGTSPRSSSSTRLINPILSSVIRAIIKHGPDFTVPHIVSQLIIIKNNKKK